MPRASLRAPRAPSSLAARLPPTSSCCRYEPCFSKRERDNLLGTQRYVTGDLINLKTTLYKTYLDQCSSGVS